MAWICALHEILRRRFPRAHGTCLSRPASLPADRRILEQPRCTITLCRAKLEGNPRTPDCAHEGHGLTCPAKTVSILRVRIGRPLVYGSHTPGSGKDRTRVLEDGGRRARTYLPLMLIVSKVYSASMPFPAIVSCPPRRVPISAATSLHGSLHVFTHYLIHFVNLKPSAQIRQRG